MHQQEEPGQVSNPAGERDPDPEGERPRQTSARTLGRLFTCVCFLQELKHDNIVALLDFQVRHDWAPPRIRILLRC